MNTEIALQQLTALPENMQSQVVDYIEFLFDKYIISSKVEKVIDRNQEYEEELSPELKVFLEERLDDYIRNPEKVMQWQDMEARLLRKYNYAV